MADVTAVMTLIRDPSLHVPWSSLCNLNLSGPSTGGRSRHPPWHHSQTARLTKAVTLRGRRCLPHGREMRTQYWPQARNTEVFGLQTGLQLAPFCIVGCHGVPATSQLRSCGAFSKSSHQTSLIDLSALRSTRHAPATIAITSVICDG